MTTTDATIPEILTANCYFWRPAGAASARRSNEQRRIAEVAKFVEANRDALDAAGIEIDFDYSESCHNVYKHCRITRCGKRSNITAVVNLLTRFPATMDPTARLMRLTALRARTEARC